MNKKVLNIFMVIFSNLFNLLIGIMIGLVIPMVLTVPEFGQYKIYTFYTGYFAIFNFGIVDGIMLKYSKLSYEELKNKNLNFVIYLQLVIVSIISFILIGVNHFFLSDSYILFLIVISILPALFMGVFTQLYRVNLRLKWYSLYLVIPKVALGLVVLALYTGLFDMYTIIYVTIVTDILLMFIGFINYRKLFISKINFSSGIREYFSLIYYGFPSVLSYFVATLATGLDRIFIEKNNSVYDYAYYAFAFSLLMVVIGVITSVSGVILPYLSRASEYVKMKAYKVFTKSINLFGILSSLGLLLVPWFITSFLPKYEDSIIIFFIIYPVVIYKVQYTLKQRQYIFLFKKPYLNLLLNTIVLGIVFVLNILVLVLKLHYIYYAVATLVSYIIWNLIVEIVFERKYKFGVKKEVVIGIISSVLVMIYAYDFTNNLFTIGFVISNLLLVIVCYSGFIRKIVLSIKRKDINLLLE